MNNETTNARRDGVRDGVVFTKHVEGDMLASQLSVRTDENGQRDYFLSGPGEEGSVRPLRVQHGALKEEMRNGYLVEELAAAALNELRIFNKEFPCRQNSISITKLEEALFWQEDRKNERVERGVEGTRQA